MTPQAEIIGSMEDIPAAQWDALAGADSPFVCHAFLSALEQSGSATARTGWRPLHLLLREGTELTGAVPCYLKSHSQGEYVFDHGWADAFERAGGRYYPKMQVSVPFTPANGPRLMVRDDRHRASLIAALEAVALEVGASSVHATFLTAQDQAAFAEAGWLARTDQQFHWHNRGYGSFEDFLGQFRSDKRKQIRRERREAVAAGLEIRHLTGAEITEAHWDAFFVFYQETGSRKWGRPYLTRAFFSRIGATMADRILLMLACRDGHPIAGALNFLGRDTLFGRYWGAIEHHPFLHFELCYHQAVEAAIARGLSRVEAGAQGDHKMARGYEPVTTHSAHFIAHAGLRRAVSDYLAHERREVAAIGAALGAHLPYRRGEGS